MIDKKEYELMYGMLTEAFGAAKDEPISEGSWIQALNASGLSFNMNTQSKNKFKRLFDIVQTSNVVDFSKDQISDMIKQAGFSAFERINLRGHLNKFIDVSARGHMTEEPISEGPSFKQRFKTTMRKMDPTIRGRLMAKADELDDEGDEVARDLIDMDADEDDMMTRGMKPSTYHRNADRYRKVARGSFGREAMSEDVDVMYSTDFNASGWKMVKTSKMHQAYNKSERQWAGPVNHVVANFFLLDEIGMPYEEGHDDYGPTRYFTKHGQVVAVYQRGWDSITEAPVMSVRSIEHTPDSAVKEMVELLRM